MIKMDNKKEEESKYCQMSDKNSANKIADKSDDKDRDEDNDDECEEEYNPVNECAFWHIEATIGNVFNTGMLVEIEHSPLKYWLATVVGAFGQLLSLKWEGAEGEPDFWFDLKNRKIYPVGYYRDNRDFKIEPPLNLKLETKNIVDVTVKYFKNQTSIASCVKLNLFTKYGFTNLSDIFMPQSVVIEVSHEFEPHKYWFAKVVKNFGGRLTLEWIETLDSSEETKEENEKKEFYLYFCSPRISHLGYANSKVEDEFFYSPPNESITNTEKIIDKYLDDSSSEVNQLVKSVILTAKELQPNLYKNGCLDQIKVNDKVLVFPNKLLKLCPATVERVAMDGRHIVIKCDSDDSIRFCYPNHDNHCFLPLNWAEEHQISAEFGDGGISKYLNKSGFRSAPITLQKDSRIDEFETNTKLEVIHPKDKNKICEGIIIRITPPLIWIEIASDTITVLPYNSTDMYPLGWCHNNGLEAIKLLTNDKKNSKKNSNESEVINQTPKRDIEEEEDSNLPSSPTMASSQSQCSSKSWCPRIFINHKCFTGPALSKSKICELPQYVGPGPIHLVLQEVISKIIQVAYVPNRVLNELSSQTFQDLLKKKDIKKTDEIMFKAKYQKRTYRDDVLVARNADQVEEYCRCVCGHLKCCYNLFSPFQFSGDDCPSNCRGLTKSNKYLKRAGYYRDKARHNRLAQNKKKMTLLPTNEDNDNNDNNNDNNSIESNTIKTKVKNEVKNEDNNSQPTNDGSSDESTNNDNIPIDAEELHKQQQQKELKKDSVNNQTSKKSKNSKPKVKRKRSVIEEEEIEVDENEDIDNPLYWTISDVHEYLKKSNCFMFAPTLREHEVDGAALLLLDYNTITSLLYSGYTRQYCMADASKLSALVESLRHKWARIAKRLKK